MGRSPVRKAKDKAWKMFSKYIRLRDADKNGYCTCCTCGVKRQWDDDFQAGHFVNSRNNTVLFDENLVHAQCKSCNYFKGGMQAEYTLFMLRKGYTAEELTEMLSRKHQTKKMTISDYMELIDELSDKLAGLDFKETQ